MWWKMLEIDRGEETAGLGMLSKTGTVTDHSAAEVRILGGFWALVFGARSRPIGGRSWGQV